MISCANSTSKPGPLQSQPSARSGRQEFVSIGKAARLLCVAEQTLRNYERDGLLKSYRTLGGSKHGHRRYRLSELQQQVLGVDSATEKDDEQGKAICIGDSIRWCDTWRKWLFWDGCRWAIDNRCAVEVAAKTVAKDLWLEVVTDACE
jgi:hypothetical protein